MSEQGKALRIVVIGGGITGLSAANRLIELGTDRRIPIELLLLEADRRVGGVIQTVNHKEFLIESGPDNFITDKPWAVSLCKRLKILDQLIKPNTTYRRVLVARGSGLVSVPEGFGLLSPTKLAPILSTPLFSPGGKLRIAMEPFIRARKEVGDESLASFVSRRFGREMLERLVQPLVGGIYTADPNSLSLRATLPRFVDMEARYGSITKAMKRDARKHVGNETAARYSLFVTFKDGMKTLVDALARRIGDERIRLSTPVARVGRADGKQDGEWQVDLEDGRTVTADGVIIACSTHRAASMLQRLDYNLGQLLNSVPYASSAVVHFAFHREQIEHPLDAFGFIVPHIEKRYVIACSFSSVKYPGRAPNDYVLLRAFLGGALNEDLMKGKDEALIAQARWDLECLLGIHGKPVLITVNRYPKGMPQYVVGHQRRIGGVRQSLLRKVGLQLAGNGFEGVGIPECVRDGERAAKSVLSALTKPI